MPVDHLAAAEREHLHCGAVALGGDAEHVDRAGLAPVGALLLGQVLDREEPVAVAGSVLVALLGGRVAHLLLQLAHDRLRVAGEKVDHALDHRPVVLLRDVTDARRVAALDVEVEARDPGVAPGLGALAGPELEDAVEDVERLPHLLRVRVRPEVEDAAAMALAREHDPRVLVLDRDRDVRKRLVVAQAHVERRPVALDQVLLEVERLHLAAGDDHLEVGDPRHEPRNRRSVVAAPLLEVRAHARPERLRLADVEDVAALVPEEVDARLRGNRLQFPLDV